MTTFTTLAMGGSTNVTRGQETSQVVKIELASADVIALPQVAGDKVTALTIPANSFVEVLQIAIRDANMTGCTRVDVGDSGSDTQWVSNASTLTKDTNLTIANANKVYSSADTLFVKYTTGTLTGTATVCICVRITDLNRDTKAKPKVYTN